MDIQLYIKELRGGHVPTLADVETYFRVPVVYQLRESLVDSDLPWLMDLCRRPEVRNDVISLITGWVQSPDVWQWIKKEWQNATTFEWKQGLLWLLSENPAWPVGERRAAASWLLANLGPYLTHCSRWWGSPTERLSRVLSSLNHRGRPPEKAFMYLCVCMGSSDLEGARRLLLEFSNDSTHDAIAVDVARRLLSVLDSLGGAL